MSTSPKLYFVKVDVRAAYDTIQQDKLLQIVEAVLEEVTPLRSTRHERESHAQVEPQTIYWIQRYSQVSPVAGSSLKSFKRVACTDGESSCSRDGAGPKSARTYHSQLESYRRRARPL